MSCFEFQTTWNSCENRIKIVNFLSHDIVLKTLNSVSFRIDWNLAFSSWIHNLPAWLRSAVKLIDFTKNHNRWMHEFARWKSQAVIFHVTLSSEISHAEFTVFHHEFTPDQNLRWNLEGVRIGMAWSGADNESWGHHTCIATSRACTLNEETVTKPVKFYILLLNFSFWKM